VTRLERVPALVYKGLSLLLTGLFLMLAVAVGGGTPPSPGAIASAASEAADNLERAQANIRAAAEDTEVLASIAEDVDSQLQSSRRMLETQLDIEQSSKEGLAISRDLAGSIEDVAKALQGLEGKLRALSEDSAEVTGSSESIELAARNLDSRLDVLIDRFKVVTRESRELNRKARGLEGLRP
jgi:methyl-accepting chemotaxis protein